MNSKPGMSNPGVNESASAHTPELVRYDAMCRAIAECHQVDEVKDIRDKALALEAYSAQAKNSEAERKACEIRAERRAGELLKEMAKTGERQISGDSRPGRPSESPTLSDLGISKDQSSKWQALAQVPDKDFEAALCEPDKKPSTKGILDKRPMAGERQTSGMGKNVGANITDAA